MSNMVFAVIAAIGILTALALFLIIKPLRGILKLILHTVFGWGMLLLWNLLLPGLLIGVNPASATVAGVLGIPGLLLMVLAKEIFQF